MIRPLERWPRWLVVVVSLGVILLVGSADYLTGHEIMFSTFYLVAVALAAWMVGRAFAAFIAVLSVGAWLAGDLAAGAVYSQAFVPAWNAAIILAVYLVVVVLIGRLREMQHVLEERVRQRTVALTEEIAERERLEREILEVGERERRRVGRDLHDSLGQLLTGTALAGQVLQEKLAARAIEEASDASRIVSLVEEAIEQTRSLSRGLDPAEVEGGGLAEGLRALAATTERLAGVRCECHTSGAAAVADNETATHLYRIAQEAITNAIKHGRASLVVVSLAATPAGVRLSVHDDGVGLPADGRRGSGMGLRIMAHRAAMIGGTFSVEPEPTGGTTVTCEVPPR